MRNDEVWRVHAWDERIDKWERKDFPSEGRARAWASTLPGCYSSVRVVAVGPSRARVDEREFNDWNGCSEDCVGLGVFGVDRVPFWEVQRCDACERFVDDDEAAVHLVRSLELGYGWAREMVLRLIPDDDVEDEGEDE